MTKQRDAGKDDRMVGYVARHPDGIRLVDLASLMGINGNAAGVRARYLRDQGRIAVVGRGPHARWCLPAHVAAVSHLAESGTKPRPTLVCTSVFDYAAQLARRRNPVTLLQAPHDGNQQ